MQRRIIYAMSELGLGPTSKPGDGRIAMVACDVAGHVMASGLVLAAMRGGFTMLRRSMTGPAASPAVVLEQLHDLVLHTSRQRLLATAAVVMIDRNARRATVASAATIRGIILRDVEAFRGSAPQDDDLTIVVAKLT